MQEPTYKTFLVLYKYYGNNYGATEINSINFAGAETHFLKWAADKNIDEPQILQITFGA